ncbi:MAG TPA: hypothetical protein VIF35_10010 [Streptosporangiaceae bacterium]
MTSIHGKARTTGRYHGSTTAARIEETIDEHITGSWARRRPAAQADLDSIA